MGKETFFLTGTDEHGQKVQQAAEARGVDPMSHCDETCERFKELWQRLGISHDHFIRTTDPDHIHFVQLKLKELWDKGEIYAKDYEGWYCVGCERFYAERDLQEGKCPEDGRKVNQICEKNYFFKMSKYQDWLIDHIKSNPRFIFPESRANEVLGFLRQPLADLCISRPKSRLSWGIELPFDADYVTYVWFDALLNYASGVSSPERRHFYPADIHLIGKDILTTHAVYWPTMLKAMGMEQPRTILAHGWWLIKDSKMSKSVGNVVNPMDMLDKAGVDALRYYLMREMVLGQDSDFSEESFLRRVNSDLSNDLGNMLSRIVKFSGKNFAGELRLATVPEDPAAIDLRRAADKVIAEVGLLIEDFRLSQALDQIMELVRAINRYFDFAQPWKRVKDEPEAVQAVLCHASEALRIVLEFLGPVMPEKSREGLARLGLAQGAGLLWRSCPLAFSITQGPALFPRLEEPEAVAEAKKVTEAKNPTGPSSPARPWIIRARIIAVRNHPQADKLYHLDVEDGERTRSICAGLKGAYAPDLLQGRYVALLANLKPALLRGILSEGMVLAAENTAGELQVVNPGEGKLGEVFQPTGAPLEPAKEIQLKNFQKMKLSLLGGCVHLDGQKLNTPRDCPLTADFADGSAVR